MNVGVLQFFSWPERRVPIATVYERALERIAIMDRAGYTAVWLAEHHFTSFSVCPSVHMMGVYAAARTKRLRIGTAVSLAAFYHPLRLAEEVALLDVLSGGRVNWGAGRGFDRTEFTSFGVPPDESVSRFRETVEIVLRAWTGERLTYHGEHFSFDGVEVLPKPLQKPHPPTWVAASSEPAIAWAASRGLSILMDPHSSHEEIARKQALYTKGLEEGGYSVEGREIPVARLLAIAPTDREAEDVARRGATWILESYAGPGKNAVLPGGHPQAVTSENPVERYVRDTVIHGTPGAVADEIARLRETMDLESLLVAPLSHQTFVSFTDDVLPRLR